MEFVRYLGTLASPFFRWWWALITGIATLLSFFAWKTEGLALSGTQVALAVLIFFTLGFFVLSVLVQGFKWYTRAHHNPEVLTCAPATSDSDSEVFHIRSFLPLEPGQVMSLLRTIDDRVVCMGMLKVERVLSDRYQCIPLWLGAIHRRDLKQGKVQPRLLSISLLINESDLSRYLAEGGMQ